MPARLLILAMCAPSQRAHPAHTHTRVMSQAASHDMTHQRRLRQMDRAEARPSSGRSAPTATAAAAVPAAVPATVPAGTAAATPAAAAAVVAAPATWQAGRRAPRWKERRADRRHASRMHGPYPSHFILPTACHYISSLWAKLCCNMITYDRITLWGGAIRPAKSTSPASRACEAPNQAPPRLTHPPGRLRSPSPSPQAPGPPPSGCAPKAPLRRRWWSRCHRPRRLPAAGAALQHPRRR
jgi:hypothetical protein